MARKRGGLAGFWDKRKGAIKAIVPTALGMIPGVGMPLAVGSRALMEGLDRPGQGSFENLGMRDLGNLVKGGVQGYAQGMTGAGVRGALSSKETIGQAVGKYNQPLQRLLNPTGSGGAKGAAQLTADRIPRMPPGLTGNEPAQSVKFTQALLQPQVLSGAVQGGLSMLPDAKSAAMEAQTKLAQEQFDEEKRRFEQQRQDRAAIARLLMPMYEDYMKQLGYSR